jgi:hypothetical protein
MKQMTMRRLAALLATGLLAATAHAALPAPTPAAQQAAADKKAKADAQAAKDKESLVASMETVAGRWRARAASQGWQTHPAVAIAAPPAAAPAGTPGAGVGAAVVPGAPASAAGAAVGTAATGNGPAGQPNGSLTQGGSAVPIRSEKLGTAPPSEDVKKHPTRAQPAGMAPTVVKKNTPQVDNK